MLFFILYYSLFSIKGVGEPILSVNAYSSGMGGLYNFKLSEKISFISSLNSIITLSNGIPNFAFTLPYYRFNLPLTRKFIIDCEIAELYDLNFYIESGKEEFFSDSVQRKVIGKGSASLLKFGLGKILRYLLFEVGYYFIFGSAQEEWITDFGNLIDAYDTLNFNFSGKNIYTQLNTHFYKFTFNFSYLFPTTLIDTFNFHTQCMSNLFFSLNNVKLGIGFVNYPMKKYSAGVEFLFNSFSLLLGGYSGKWYNNINEKVYSFGFTYSLPSLLKINMSFEFGKRYDSLLSEKIYRVCLTLEGSEEVK